MFIKFIKYLKFIDILQIFFTAIKIISPLRDLWKQKCSVEGIIFATHKSFVWTINLSSIPYCQYLPKILHMSLPMPINWGWEEFHTIRYCQNYAAQFRVFLPRCKINSQSLLLFKFLKIIVCYTNAAYPRYIFFKFSNLYTYRIQVIFASLSMFVRATASYRTRYHVYTIIIVILRDLSMPMRDAIPWHEAKNPLHLSSSFRIRRGDCETPCETGSLAQ